MVRKREIKVLYYEYDNTSDLNPEEQKLLKTSSAAALNAYAPYSGFKVGAALMLEDGTVITGNNQENAAYPSGLCAERVATFTAGAQYPNRKIKSIAITAHSDNIKITFPVPPCGACRQVLAEYEKRYKCSIKVILQGETGKILTVDSVAELLPLVFDNNKLLGKK